ncbi:MAG: hypothetical protein V3T70_01150, partial [Phycisphaerae bacterium]
MNQISTTSFSTKDITTEYAVVQQVISGDVGLLGIVLALRGLDAGNATRELRIFIDGITIDSVSTNNVPANQADSFFSETHGATATRL